MSTKSAHWQVTGPLIPMAACPPDAQTQEVIDRFMDTVNEKFYLAQFSYTKDQVLAENNVSFSNLKDLGKVHTDHNLGDLIANT